VEHLYLPQLLRLFLDFGLGTEMLGLEISTKLDKLARRIKDLRNRVHHPVRTILPDAKGVIGLWEELDLVEEIIFRLRPRSYPGYAPPPSLAKAGG
jgi:hypothetical protein